MDRCTEKQASVSRLKRHHHYDDATIPIITCSLLNVWLCLPNVAWGTQGRLACRFVSRGYWCYSPAPAPAEECSSVIRCSFELRTSKCVVASLQHSRYILICLAEQCSQITYTTDNTPGQHVVPGQCFFEANTAKHWYEVQLSRAWL